MNYIKYFEFKFRMPQMLSNLIFTLSLSSSLSSFWKKQNVFLSESKKYWQINTIIYLLVVSKYLYWMPIFTMIESLNHGFYLTKTILHQILFWEACSIRLKDVCALHNFNFMSFVNSLMLMVWVRAPQDSFSFHMLRLWTPAKVGANFQISARQIFGMYYKYIHSVSQ